MESISREVPNVGWVKIGTPCANCRGQGTIGGEQCIECRGSGEKVVNVSLDAFIRYIDQDFGNEMRHFGGF